MEILKISSENRNPPVPDQDLHLVSYYAFPKRSQASTCPVKMDTAARISTLQLVEKYEIYPSLKRATAKRQLRTSSHAAELFSLNLNETLRIMGWQPKLS